MKKILLVFVLAAVMAPAALAVELSTPAAFCKNVRTTSPLLFGPGATYRTLGACVSVQSAKTELSSTNAAALCKAEQADTGFAATHGGKTFPEVYGANGKAKGAGAGRNAFGACVSQRAQDASAAQQTAEMNAAKKCKAMRADPGFTAAHGGKTFAQFYGTNGNLRNAFGKCVSSLAKAKNTTTPSA